MIGAALGNNGAVWQVVDRSGKVHHAGLTYGAANAMAEVMMLNDPGAGIHTKPDIPEVPKQSPGIDPRAAAALAQTAQAAALAAIKAGTEREVLKHAIEQCQKATDAIAQTQSALARAKDIRALRQSELDTLTAAHHQTIQTDGARLALALRLGDAGTDVASEVDRSALLDASVRLDTAKAAVDQLEKELADAETEGVSAEADRRIAIKAVMGADAESMAQWLRELKQETSVVHAMLAALKYRDVRLSLNAQEVLSMTTYGDETAAIYRWRVYGEALAEDPNAQLGALK